jgi:hypothetical protein
LSVIPDTIVYDGISIKRITIDIGKSATIEVQLFSNNHLRDIRSLAMSGEDYLQWGNDDSYVINLAMKELGVTPS